MLRKFFKRHPRITQFTCAHLSSEYVGQCLGEKGEEYPVYQCYFCGLIRIGDDYNNYWKNPFSNSRWHNEYLTKNKRG